MTTTVTLRQHFTRLLDFSGREDRASFWPYAAVAFVLLMIVGMLVLLPIMLSTFRSIQQFAAQNPDQVTTVQTASGYSVSVRGDHPAFLSAGEIILYLATTFGSAILLYAAAVVRRLRDTGRSGAWGLLPLPFILYSSLQMPRMFAAIGSGTGPDMTVFFSIFISNLLYMVSLVALIVLLAARSRPAAA